MKLSFEGSTYGEIVEQMKHAVADFESSGQVQDEATPVPGVVKKFDLPERQTQHVESVGKVWEPVEGKQNAFMGTPKEDYDADIDAAGMPWDKRIHAETKTKVANGTWKYRRGVKDDVIAQIEAEIKAGLPAKAVPSFGSMPPEQYQAHIARDAAAQAPIAPPAPMTSNVVQMPTLPTPSVPAAPTLPTPAAPPAPVIGADGRIMVSLASFKAHLPNILVDLTNAKKINEQYTRDLCAYFKVSSLFDVVKSDADSKALFDAFIKHGLITGV